MSAAIRRRYLQLAEHVSGEHCTLSDVARRATRLVMADLWSEMTERDRAEIIAILGEPDPSERRPS
jgi:hypothetical protein